MKRKLYLVGAAHLDPVWLWDWREGFQANKATVLSALNRMEEFDDFVFSCTSAQFYEWIEENAPAMFAKIQQRVREGRWTICGGWWIQPDCNIPSGESFARQGLLAQRYFYEKFGRTATVGFCADSFGHNAMLPQILKKSGMDNYMFLRPMPHEKELPSRTFLWQSPDGSQVRAYRLPISYHLGDNRAIGLTLEQQLDRIVEEPQYGIGNMMGFYGVGDHGGGPTVDVIKRLHAYQEQHRDELDVVYSGPEPFFEELRNAELPVWTDELQHHAPGCYSACSMIKEMNRRSENALLSAEKLSVLSASLGKYRCRENLNLAWKQVLFNQFHDILAGTATEAAYVDARNQLGEAISVADRCKNHAVQSMSFAIGIPQKDGTQPMVVFNPHGWEIAAPVEVDLAYFRIVQIPDNMKILDSDGNKVPFQIVECGNKIGTRRTVSFIARVPALGYQTYRIESGEQPSKMVMGSSHVLENELLRVEFDESRGTISKIYDKRLKEYTMVQPARVRVIDDDTDTWGHSIVRLDQEIGEFRTVQARCLDTGSVRCGVSFRSKFGDSTLKQSYYLYAGEDMVRVKAEIDWHEKRRALKIDWPVAAENAEASVEIPFGSIRKLCDGREEPMQCWADLSGENSGIAILNESKYSVDFREGVIGFTVLRSPIYVHHDPYAVRTDEDYNYMEQGVQKFAYAVKSHPGKAQPDALTRAAMVLNQPPVLTLETFHDGDLPQKMQNFSVSAENILLSALKEGYDGGTVLRLYEAAGRAVTADISVLGTEFTASFGPFEIKTFLLKDGGAAEVNLLEWDDTHE